MRSQEELQVELVRTRRRLHRVTGVMTFVFIAGVAVVFAAVGGALVVVDKRAAQTLQPAPSSESHQVATTGAGTTGAGTTGVASTGAATTGSAPRQRPPSDMAAAQAAQAPTKEPPPPIVTARSTSTEAGATVGASAGARVSTAAAPAIPPPQPTPQVHPQEVHPQAPTPSTLTTTAAVNPTAPASQAKHPAPQQLPSGSGRDAVHAAHTQPVAAPAAKPAKPTDARHTARTRSSRDRKTAKNTREDNTREDEANVDNPRHDARATVGAAPDENASRAEDARERRRGYVRVRPDDEEAADARGPQRVIVVDPRQRFAPRAAERDDDERAPPRHQDGGLFGGVLSGIFGPPD